MNFEDMQERLIDGLTIIENTEGDLDVIAHTYLFAVPGAEQSNYSDSDVEELQKELGWAWSDDMGWVFPCLA